MGSKITIVTVVPIRSNVCFNRIFNMNGKLSSITAVSLLNRFNRRLDEVSAKGNQVFDMLVFDLKPQANREYLASRAEHSDSFFLNHLLRIELA